MQLLDDQIDDEQNLRQNSFIWLYVLVIFHTEPNRTQHQKERNK